MTVHSTAQFNGASEEPGNVTAGSPVTPPAPAPNGTTPPPVHELSAEWLRDLISDTVAAEVRQQLLVRLVPVEVQEPSLRERVGEKARGVTSRLHTSKDAATSAAEAVSEKASEVKDDVSETASEIKDEVKEDAKEAAGRARRFAHAAGDRARHARRATAHGAAEAGKGLGAAVVTGIFATIGAECGKRVSGKLFD